MFNLQLQKDNVIKLLASGYASFYIYIFPGVDKSDRKSWGKNPIQTNFINCICGIKLCLMSMPNEFRIQQYMAGSQA